MILHKRFINIVFFRRMFISKQISFNGRYGIQEIIRFYCQEESEEEKIIKVTQNIGFIGDGNMAKAICRSIQNKGVINYSQVYVSSPYVKNLDIWKNLGANITTDNGEVAAKSDIIFLAVKPQILAEAVESIYKGQYASQIKDKLFISILAGFTLDVLEKMISNFPGSRIVRAMPNTPMLVGEGCTVYCPGKNVTQEDLQLIENMLKVTGYCKLLPEHMINAFGALSASGPALVYSFIEALSDGAVRMGIHREVATKIAAQTVLGSAKMVQVTAKHTGVLKDEVCSAGGTTIAGIHEFERGGVRAAIMNAIEASTKRAVEIGNK